MIDYYAALIATIPTTAATPTDSTSTTHVTYTITPPCPSSSSSSPLPCHSHLTDADTLTLLESRNVISSSGHTGSRTWEAALALGELLISSHHRTSHPLTFPPLPQNNTTTTAAAAAHLTSTTIFTTTLTHKSILELGAGTGFLSILCAKLGAHRVLATDGDWRVCATLRENVAGNNVAGVVDVGRLLWGTSGCGVVETTAEPDDPQEYITPDIVLAADVVRRIPSYMSSSGGEVGVGGGG